MNDAYKLYLREIEKFPTISKDAENKCFVAIKENGNEKARRIIYKANLRFVVKMAHKYKYRGVDILDLISEGNLSLDTAITEFDHTKNIKFISFAVHRIKQAMLELLARQGNEFAVNGTEQTRNLKLNKARRKLAQKLFREPTVEELRIETGFTAKKVLHMTKTIGCSHGSLDTIVGKKEEKVRLSDLIADTSEKFESPDTENLNEQLDTFFKQADLDKQSIGALKAIFGIDCEPTDLEKVGFDYGLTRERMRQIKETAITALQSFDRKSKSQKLPNVFRNP